MVAAADIGKLAAELLQEKCEGHRVIELEGPRGSPIRSRQLLRNFWASRSMQVVPRESWDALFRSQGMKNPIPRMRMLDGFNEGWIEFEQGKSGSQKGSTSFEAALKSVIEQESTNP